jgi:hypothetical protein
MYLLNIECVSAQLNKTKGDALKMLLIEKIKGVEYNKLLVVVDEKLFYQLRGKSWLAEVIRQFNIEIKLIDIPFELWERIIEAQKKQDLTDKVNT